MKITVNSNEVDTQAVNVSQLVAGLGFGDTKIALAINNKMVPKDEWESTDIAEGQKIIIIKAVCGG